MSKEIKEVLTFTTGISENLQPALRSQIDKKYYLFSVKYHLGL